ncbi:S4 domain-containing protein [Altererythrobacter arenosus]|uniref:S4 domain-containing protein n=1 Tax=Altererythrobacter arenosus TaxID=3032592 RepID=A0ABY8G1S8_9SPHN|nr:S4 domain-containing protein [Altererythrobacter sp. CAU 1644]WFL78679.1 S4 domain-containing protein [Altererythrobacter sp. CAU 1644]
MTESSASGGSMRLDRWLVYCRFARTRSRASALIEAGHIRCNGAHVRRSSACVHPGDVLTIPLGEAVRIIEVVGLPERRSSPGLARSHYRELDRDGDIAIAPS